MTLQKLFLFSQRLVAECMADQLPLLCVADVICSNDTRWLAHCVRSVKASIFLKRCRAMTIDIFPSFRMNKRYLIRCKSNNGAILSMELFKPFMGVAFENPSLRHNNGSTGNYWSRESSIWMEEQIIGNFGGNVRDLQDEHEVT